VFLISDSLQQKDIGGKEDLCPMNVITADPCVDWAHKEGAISVMVSLELVVPFSLITGRFAMVFS
jgi:hypothetical protein